MIESLVSLAQGAASLLTAANLLIIALGSIVGTVVGALPGLGPSAGIALMIPLTFTLPVDQALSLLVGVYMGTMYGGRITAILINTPGDAPAIMTAADGYPMMQQGQGGQAMGLSAIASFIGGTFGLLVLIFLAPVISNLVINFGAPEYFMLMLLGLATISLLTDGSLLKAVMMTAVGFVIGMVGADYISGYVRWAFTPQLLEGVEFVFVIIGMYGLGEVFFNVEQEVRLDLGKPSFKMSEYIPGAKLIKKTLPAMFRGSLIGTVVGILPGAGASIATFLAYATEKKISKTPERFGKGSGGCQQRLRPRCAGPSAGTGHPWIWRHGHLPGGADHVRHDPRPAADGQIRRHCLADDCGAVHGQPLPAVLQCADDPPLCQPDPVHIQESLPAGAGVLLCGRLRAEL